MKRYIALLRGINVGGKNKVSMAKLKESLENFGFTDIKTYINSGNILFSTDIYDEIKLTEIFRSIIIEDFLIDIPVLIISSDYLLDITNNTPEWWSFDKELVHYAIFLIPPITIEEVFDSVGEIKPEYEKIDYYKEVIFWSTPLKTFSKSRWSKIASSSVNNNVTIRNINTVNKLISLI